MKLALTLENIPKFVEFVSQDAKRQGFNKKKISEIELATEEIIANIFYHAYKNKIGFAEILCFDNKYQFEVVIIDFASPFDAAAYEVKPLAFEKEKLKIGGLGLKLVKSSVDEIKYRREAGKNILKLIIYKD